MNNIIELNLNEIAVVCGGKNKSKKKKNGKKHNSSKIPQGLKQVLEYTYDHPSVAAIAILGPAFLLAPSIANKLGSLYYLGTITATFIFGFEEGYRTGLISFK